MLARHAEGEGAGDESVSDEVEGQREEQSDRGG